MNTSSLSLILQTAHAQMLCDTGERTLRIELILLVLQKGIDRESILKKTEVQLEPILQLELLQDFCGEEGQCLGSSPCMDEMTTACLHHILIDKYGSIKLEMMIFLVCKVPGRIQSIGKQSTEKRSELKSGYSVNLKRD